MKGSKVFRQVRVPSAFSLAHVNQLILFLFGWKDAHGDSERHRWRVVKEVVQYSAKGRHPREGEIKESRQWVEVVPACQLEEEEGGARESGRRVEDENEWTVGQVWGAGGVFFERGIIWVRCLKALLNELRWLTPRFISPSQDRSDEGKCTIDITLVQPTKATTSTNLPWLVRAKGAVSLAYIFIFSSPRPLLTCRIR